MEQQHCTFLPEIPGRPGTGSRDTHKALHGQQKPLNEPFELTDGDLLKFPGDPDGRACNVINCYCYLTQEALPPGQIATSGWDESTRNITESEASERYGGGGSLHSTSGTKIPITE